MASESIHIRVDSETKKKAEEVFSAMGITMSSGVNMFLSKVVGTQSIPFDVRVERNNLLSEQTRAEEKSAQDAIRKAIQDTKDDGVPIALYDAERGLPYMQYLDGRREYYDEG